MKSFCFTVDDNIRFFKELTEGSFESIFEHPYLAVFADLHNQYGVCVQMNVFYRMDVFDLSMMTARYRAEWEQHASWLKLSFHSELENENPYQYADYDEVFGDCAKVHREIVRFAGEASLAETTTIHYCQTTEEGLRALKDNGMKGLLGLFGTSDAPMTSYSVPLAYTAALRDGECVDFHGVTVASIDMIVNQVPLSNIPDVLAPLLERKHIRVMIHEQYFYEDYHGYQPDFRQKLETVFHILTQNGYIGTFF